MAEPLPSDLPPPPPEITCLAPGCGGEIRMDGEDEKVIPTVKNAGACKKCKVRHRRPDANAGWNEIVGPVIVRFVDDRHPIPARAVKFVWTPGAMDMVTIRPASGPAAAIGVTLESITSIVNSYE